MTAVGLALALLNKNTLGVVALLTLPVSGDLGTVLPAILLACVLTLGGYAVEARGGVGPSIVQRLLRNKRTFVATAGGGFPVALAVPGPAVSSGGRRGRRTP